jgi:hypothetical protein
MSLFSWRSDRRQRPPQNTKQVDAAIERIAESNPRLRLAPRYKTRLAPAVEISLNFANTVAQALPAPREASAAAWTQDPVIRAFFVSPEDLCQAFSRSHELRDYFEQNPGVQEAHALLGMALNERKTLGVVQQGDTVHRDVPRTTVSFGDHRARVCAGDEITLRAEITRRIVDELALRGLELITADQQRRDMLQQDRALLKTRLSLLERRGSGMRSALSGNESPDPSALAKLHAELEDNERQLAELGGHVDALRRDLERVHDVLSEPGQHLPVTERQLRLDAMNVLQTDGSPQPGVDLNLKVAHFTTEPPQTRAFALVRFPRSELRSASDILDEAARLLV